MQQLLSAYAQLAAPRQEVLALLEQQVYNAVYKFEGGRLGNEPAAVCRLPPTCSWAARALAQAEPPHVIAGSPISQSLPLPLLPAAEENPQLARWGDLLFSSSVETLYSAAVAEAGLTYVQAYTDSFLGVVFYLWRVVRGCARRDGGAEAPPLLWPKAASHQAARHQPPAAAARWRGRRAAEPGSPARCRPAAVLPAQPARLHHPHAPNHPRRRVDRFQGNRRLHWRRAVPAGAAAACGRQRRSGWRRLQALVLRRQAAKAGVAGGHP
jgi:hypothetical protein